MFEDIGGGGVCGHARNFHRAIANASEPDMAEVMETAEAWIHGNFNRTAVHILETCFAGEVTVVQSMTNGALTQGLEAANSMPWQAFSGLTLAVAMLLMFLGWYLVRAVNLFGGLYIGASVSMFLLTFSAGTPLMGNCSAMISVVTVSSLLCAIICLVYRKSMYLVLGMIAGEIVGKFVYHLCLESAGLGSNTLYITVGFFAMVGAYAVKEVGDLAWMICTALMGAYFATTALVELVPSHLLASLLLAAHPSPPHPSSRGLPLRPAGPSRPPTWLPHLDRWSSRMSRTDTTMPPSSRTAPRPTSAGSTRMSRTLRCQSTCGRPLARCYCSRSSVCSLSSHATTR